MDLEKDSNTLKTAEGTIPGDDKLENKELTEINVRYFNEATADRTVFRDLSIGSEADKTRLMNLTKLSRTTRDHIQIIPNDRRIPPSLLDDMEETLGFSYLDRSSGVDNKGIPTRLGGIRPMSNFLHTGDSGHSETIANSSILTKDSTSSYSYNSELWLTKSYLKNVHNNYQRLKERFHKLHEDYYKLIRVAGELTIALENSVRGNPVDLPSTLKSCMNVYPDLFNQNVRDNAAEIKSLKSEIELQHDDLTDSKRPILGIVPISPKLFDYKKIKLHLIGANVKTKLLLLQALRWKITLSQPAERDEVIHEYTSSDLLGLHGQIASDSGKSVLPYLLIPLDVVLPHPLQQSAARLLNTLASFRCGRDYLSIGPSVLNVVIQCLDTAKAENVDAFTCDMILAMLQKMSLRRQQRLYMIGMGLVEWLIYHLKGEHQKIGTYRLEYTTALLMNLSLDREAQVRAATMSTLVLSTLAELLSSAHLPAIPYVLGALNSFLTNNTINREAKELGLDNVLEYHRRRSSGEIRKNLDHILRRGYATSMEDNIIVADDDSEELEILENELDELDPVKVHAGELFGEALLATCYSLSPNVLPRSSLDDDKKSSSKSSKPSETKLTESLLSEDASNVLNSSLHQTPTRLTPSKSKLTKKNTSPLKVIGSLGSLMENSKDFPVMMNRSIEAFVIDYDLSVSRNNSFYKLASISRSVNPSTGSLSPNGTTMDSDPTVVNSMQTLASAYESAAKVESQMSSVASLNTKTERTNEILEMNRMEKGQKKDDEEAFLSKPRIMRTPPNSAAKRMLTLQDGKDIDDCVLNN